MAIIVIVIGCQKDHEIVLAEDCGTLGVGVGQCGRLPLFQQITTLCQHIFHLCIVIQGSCPEDMYLKGHPIGAGADQIIIAKQNSGWQMVAVGRKHTSQQAIVAVVGYIAYQFAGRKYAILCYCLKQLAGGMAAFSVAGGHSQKRQNGKQKNYFFQKNHPAVILCMTAG